MSDKARFFILIIVFIIVFGGAIVAKSNKMSDKTTEQAAEESDYDVLYKAYVALSDYSNWQKEQRVQLQSTITAQQLEIEKLRKELQFMVDQRRIYK